MAGKSEYKNQWLSQNYDRINLTVKKGRKAEIQACAESCGMSLNSFINAAVDAAISKHKGEKQ